MSADEPAIDTEVIEENPCIVTLANRWVIMNPGAGLTPDGLEVERVPCEAWVSSFMSADGR
jgi:hypothetical protein